MARESGGVWAKVYPDAMVLGNGRNLLYNGAMQVHQRGTSATGITTGAAYYTADRWVIRSSQAALEQTWTQSVESDAPSGTGFSKSLKMLVTSGAASPSRNLLITQYIEGQDLQHLEWGYANAKTTTLSFWVKSNVVGDYLAQLNVGNREETFTIDVANTWEYKSVTFNGNTDSLISNDNSRGLSVDFKIIDSVGVTAQVTNTNDYFQITGVQWEVGETATEFEHKKYVTELAECQRYYEKSYDTGTLPGTATGEGLYHGGGVSNQVGNVQGSVPLKVTKRAAPTVSLWDNAGRSGEWDFARSALNGSNPATAYSISNNGFTVYVPVGENWVAGSLAGHWVAEAEL